MMMTQLLIIDRHPVVRAGIRYFLGQQSNITVIGEAESYSAAWDMYRQTRPDVAIMDLCLADHEGFEFARRVCHEDRDAGILGFAAQRNPILKVRASNAGIKGLVYKTDEPNQLLRAIETLAKGDSFFDEDLEVGKDSLFWGIHLLTPREFEVFRFLAEGHTVIEIAGILKSSPKTVGVHQTRIIKKLGVENSAQLAHIALGGGVIELKPIAASPGKSEASAAYYMPHARTGS
ncbi:response regulator transcription factor [Methyloterricola oryzae]|uniref:response regulator transcription factor n=1 Tax=Methyloterricola oryzae TaxID=1495050 RepID=UPI0006999B28|nr:response regulator transcription factor [Methyloterricola oryzae]